MCSVVLVVENEGNAGFRIILSAETGTHAKAHNKLMQFVCLFMGQGKTTLTFRRAKKEKLLYS